MDKKLPTDGIDRRKISHWSHDYLKRNATRGQAGAEGIPNRRGEMKLTVSSPYRNHTEHHGPDCEWCVTLFEGADVRAIVYGKEMAEALLNGQHIVEAASGAKRPR